MKAKELSEAHLDYWVAKANGDPDNHAKWSLKSSYFRGHWDRFSPTVNWSQAGEIIQRFKIEISPLQAGWVACMPYQPQEFRCKGKNPLEAAMRCYVLARLGTDVEWPADLEESWINAERILAERIALQDEMLRQARMEREAACKDRK